MRGALVLGALLACGTPSPAPQHPAPAPVSVPTARPPRTTPVRFDWPSPVAFRVDFTEETHFTDGTVSERAGAFYIAYRREAPGLHRFWEAGVVPDPSHPNARLEAMEEVGVVPSFAINASLRHGDQAGEGKWIIQMLGTSVLADPQSRQAAMVSAMLADEDFRRVMRDERWSEWAYPVAEWGPFFTEPASTDDVRIDEPDGWSGVWRFREENGVAILTSEQEGDIEHAPMRQNFELALAMAHRSLAHRSHVRLTLELHTDPDTMVPASLVTTRELVTTTFDGKEVRGTYVRRCTYSLAPVGTPLWKPLD